jgi:predicted Zn-dependent protease
MQNDDFYDLADFLTARLNRDEVFTCTFSGEDSDFVRFNQNWIRQAGRVQQRHLSLDLIQGRRHAQGRCALTGERGEDAVRLTQLLDELRRKRLSLPEDPHLRYATQVNSTEQRSENRLIPAAEAVQQIMAAGEGRDLVGLFASGGLFNGFANSLGQRNGFSTYTFNFDWSFYHQGDKAVKATYAGFDWDSEALRAKMEAAGAQLAVLAQEPKTLPPGKYRVFLSPAAVYNVVGLLGWGGFGLKSHRTKQTPLLKMMEGGALLHPALTILENTAEGVAPNFDSQGFLKPDRITLIAAGAYRDHLVSPRSAQEYGVETNGASPDEAPESLDIAAGDLPADQALERLDTGVLINNVWYLNYSDPPACRITGMTRFACFWVEGGQIVAPLNVMRFDETLYRAFGDNLVELTVEREMILDAGSYGGRSTGSGRVPGALIQDFNFNL